MRHVSPRVRVPRFASAPATGESMTAERLVSRIRDVWRECGHNVNVAICGGEIVSDLVSGLPRQIWQQLWERYQAARKHR